jgi:hypothetical protein
MDFALLHIVGSAKPCSTHHIPAALHRPHGRITAEWPEDTLSVVCCAGPHCNGAHRAGQ